MYLLHCVGLPEENRRYLPNRMLHALFLCGTAVSRVLQVTTKSL